MTDPVSRRRLTEAVEWWQANRDGIYIVRTADDERRDGPLLGVSEALLSAPTARWCTVHSVVSHFKTVPTCVAHDLDDQPCEFATVALVPVEDE